MGVSRVLLASTALLLALLGVACSGSSEENVAAARLSESDLEISSPSFSTVRPTKRIPITNTCHGENLSPPLSWSGAPVGIESYALIAENVDHDTGKWVHWVLYDIPVGATGLQDGIPTSTSVLPDGTSQGTNDKKQIGYYGPCPPEWLVTYASEQSMSGNLHQPPQAQRSVFSLYALDTKLGLLPGLTKAELLKAMEGHIVAQADTIGKFLPPKLIADKGGTGFLKTAIGQEGNAAQTPGATPAPNVEKIYNSLGDLITPTPAGQ